MMNFLNLQLLSHPASGWFKSKSDKSKRKPAKGPKRSFSPDSFHIRGYVKKQNPSRYNPAP